MKNEVILNPYKIVWSIEKQNTGKIVFNHYPNIEILRERLKAKKGSTVYIIPDKQYSMIQNSWNGIESDLPKPFTHKLVEKEGNYVQVIPLTKKQIEKAIHV